MDLINDSKTRKAVEEMIKKNDCLINSFKIDFNDNFSISKHNNPDQTNIEEYKTHSTNKQYTDQIELYSQKPYFSVNSQDSFKNYEDNLCYDSNHLYTEQILDNKLQEIQEENTFIDKTNSTSKLSNMDTTLLPKMKNESNFLININSIRYKCIQ